MYTLHLKIFYFEIKQIRQNFNKWRMETKGIWIVLFMQLFHRSEIIQNLKVEEKESKIV